MGWITGGKQMTEKMLLFLDVRLVKKGGAGQAA